MELEKAIEQTRARLLAERSPAGFWVGELSSSAVATAVASFALKQAGRDELVNRGLHWLETHLNFNNQKAASFLEAAPHSGQQGSTRSASFWTIPSSTSR